jgi:integrase
MARGVGFEPTRPFDHRLSRRRPSVGHMLANEGIDGLLSDFKTFCMIDLQLTEETAKTHRAKIRRFSEWLAINNRGAIDQNSIREYLTLFNGKNAHTYANQLKSLKIFCRDFLKKPEYVESFKFPIAPFKPKSIPSKIELQHFFAAFNDPKDEALFLLYSTSGLRRREALSLEIEDLNFETSMISPKPHNGRTKHTWLTFFNIECAESLKRYLSSRRDSNPKLFPFSRLREENLWHYAKVKTGLRITPQSLREWFCSEMLRLGTPETYVDCYCGRLPKSVLARHYADFSPERLREIYQKAGLKVLS